MGINDGVLVYYPLAKIQLREKAQRRSNQVKQHPEESCKSECRKDDPYGH